MRNRSSRLIVLLAGVVILASLPSAALGEGCNVWNSEPALPRFFHAAAYDSQRGVTAVFGGSEVLWSASGDTWEWDGDTWMLRSTTGPPPRIWHAMAYDSNRGVTVLFGGTGPNNESYGDTWEWDGRNWIERIVPGPPPRSDHGMAFDSARGVTVLYGGAVINDPLNSSVWEWDGATWREYRPPLWTPPSEHPHPWLLHPAMAYDSVRQVTVLFGGGTGNNNAVSDTWLWDGSSWTLGSTIGPPARYGHAMAYDSLRHVVTLYGGEPDGGQGYFDDLWDWDGTSWTERTVTTPRARDAHTMTFDSQRGEIVLFGGMGNGNRIKSETWEWNGETWTDRTVTRLYSAAPQVMAYDSQRNRIVLFGGYSQQETWERVDGVWGEVYPAISPPPRHNHAVAFDSQRGVTVAFGGFTAYDSPDPTAFSDTWEWNGIDWSLRALTGPQPTWDHAMAYDIARGATVLFGGRNTDGDYLDETWEWDGATWQQVAAPGPSPRGRPAMAYDAARGVTVLFGGAEGSASLLNDTWEWDGVAWQQKLAPGPSPRDRAAMAYDEARGLIILSGGWDGDSSDEVWEWDGTSWYRQPGPELLPVRDHGMVFDQARNAIVVLSKNGSVYESSLAVVPAEAPVDPTVTAKSRYLSLALGDPGRSTAIRLVPVDLPAGLEAYEGIPLWVTDPSTECENSGERRGPCSAVAGFSDPVIQMASLGCNPEFRIWNDLGTIHVNHELIMPGSSFIVQAVFETCGTELEAAYSPELTIHTSIWADIAGPFSQTSGTWLAPDGRVDVSSDVVAVLDKFSNLPTALPKAQVDVQPSTPDQVIDVQDLTYVIEAFQGGVYPFSPTSLPCGN